MNKNTLVIHFLQEVRFTFDCELVLTLSVFFFSCTHKSMCTHSSHLSSGLVLLVLLSSRNRNIFVNTDYHLFGNSTSEVLQLR